jgi:hypothetical protein
METSASFEARSAPSSYPTALLASRHPGASALKKRDLLLSDA